MANAALSRLNQWRVWADRRMFEAGLALTPAQLEQEFAVGQGSYLKTLQHLQAAEAVWIKRLTDTPAAKLSDIPVHNDMNELKQAWDQSDAQWQQYIDSVTDDDLGRIIAITNSRGIFGHLSAMDVILHVNTHASYTEAQGNNILRQLGMKPVDQMLATMSRAERSAS